MNLNDYKEMFKYEGDVGLIAKIHAGKHTDFKAKAAAFMWIKNYCNKFLGRS